MHFFLVLIAAGSVIAQKYGNMNPNPAHYTRWPRATDAARPTGESRPNLPPMLPEYKAEIFQCGMGAEMNGYCCQTVTKDGVGMGCNNATPLIANFVEEVITFDCPMIIKEVKQKNTIGACCSPNATMVTPTMSLYKCQGSTLTSIDVESKKPDVVGPILDTLEG
ncbi:hypothetical protein DL98DRAFT_651295 [Cadophora sp. DSE1049]|nr:hypothetical protein DL98DRAFT_651295 [Cadophora sp. DSE1049]